MDFKNPADFDAPLPQETPQRLACIRDGIPEEPMGGLIENPNDYFPQFSSHFLQSFLDSNNDEFSMGYDPELGYMPTPPTSSSQATNSTWESAGGQQLRALAFSQAGSRTSSSSSVPMHTVPPTPDNFAFNPDRMDYNIQGHEFRPQEQIPVAREPAPKRRQSSAATSEPKGENTGETPNGEDDWKPDDIFEIGYIDGEGNWRCNFGGCGSSKTYERACDLRKHYRSHIRKYFCNKEDCRWSEIGFATSKDCERHQASHNPKYRCPLIECQRTFSRADNMQHHFKTVHQSLRSNLFARPCRKTG